MVHHDTMLGPCPALRDGVQESMISTIESKLVEQKIIIIIILIFRVDICCSAATTRCTATTSGTPTTETPRSTLGKLNIKSTNILLLYK